MPVTLVAVMLVFSLWRRILPRQRRLRRSVAAVVVVAFVLTSTPAIINIGVKALEGTPQTVAEQLDALGFPPDPGDDALNAQAVLTVREGKAGRKALAEGGQVDPSSHGKVAGRGRTDSSSRREAEGRHVGARGHLDIADLDEVQTVGHNLPQRLVRIDAGARLVDVADLEYYTKITEY